MPFGSRTFLTIFTPFEFSIEFVENVIILLTV